MNDPLDDFIAPSEANNLDIGKNLEEDIEDGDLEQDKRAIGRFENPGVPVLFGGHNMPPLLPVLPVDIRLTDLPKSGGVMAPLAPPGTKALMSQVDHNDYLRMGHWENSGARKNSEAQQRQDYIFTFFYREQDLQQQRIDMFNGAIQNSIIN